MHRFGNAVLSAVALDALTKSSFFALLSVATVFLLDSGLPGNLAPVVTSGMRSVFLFAAITAPFLLARVAFRRLVGVLLLSVVVFLLVVVSFNGGFYFKVVGLLFVVTLLGFLRPITPALAIAQAPSSMNMRAGTNVLLYVSYNFGAFLSEFGSSFLYKYGGINKVALMALCLNLVALPLAVYWLPRYKPIALSPEAVKDAFGAARSWFSKKIVVSVEGRALRSILPIVIVDLMFYFAYDQIYSTMIVHTRKMNLSVLGYTFIPSQMYLINSFLVISCAGFISRLVSKVSPWTRHRVGILSVAIAYLIASLYEFLLVRLDGGLACLWDLIPYGVMTIGEILVFVAEAEMMMIYVGERFAVIGMSMIALSVAFGNLLGSFTLSVVPAINAWYFVFLAAVLVLAFLTSTFLLGGAKVPAYK